MKSSPQKRGSYSVFKAMIRAAAITALLACFVSTSLASEKDYQSAWCRKNNGTQEYKLPDQTRIDCLTDTHAIEFDYAKKWAEAVGQALHYSRMTGKLPGIVIIIEKESDLQHLRKLVPLCLKYDIDIWLTFQSDLKF